MHRIDDSAQLGDEGRGNVVSALRIRERNPQVKTLGIFGAGRRRCLSVATMSRLYAPGVPFTLAHPAAVLLLARGPLSLLALVSGALAPDLPYYLRATPLRVTADSWYEPYVNATSSHSLGQLTSVALPLALAIFLCGCLLLPPLRSIAGIASPRASASDLYEASSRGAWIVVSLVIGVLTHLGWDALTELGGAGSALLQHGSTALGLLVLAVFAYRRRGVVRWHDVTVRRNLIATSTLCALAVIAGALMGGGSWLDPSAESSTGETVEGVLADGAKGAGAGLVVAAAVLAAVWWVGRSPVRRQGPEARRTPAD